MIEFLEANLPAVVLAVALVLVLLLYLLRGRKDKRRIRHRAPDALDEGAAPAARNQALIDAPSAVTAARLADSGPNIMAGIGGVIAAGAAREVEAVPPPAPVPELSPVPQVAPKVKAAPKPKAEPKPKAAAIPKAKAEPKPKAAPRPKAEPKPKAPAKTKATPAANAKALAAPKPAPAPPPPAPKPVAAPSPPPPATQIVTPPPAPASGPEELARIKGLGPKLQALLPTLGVTTFAQIAAWDEAGIDRIDAQLGVFQGRIRKDNWVEQARFLAGGDVAGYEAKFGKL